MLLGIFIMTGLSTKSYAAPKQMSDGNIFDAEFYAANYPDVVAVLGNDETLLYNHYILCGINEGRLPYDVNVDQTLTNQNVVKPMINQVTPSIKVSDFKFLGYSINENHYYEW